MEPVGSKLPDATYWTLFDGELGKVLERRA